MKRSPSTADEDIHKPTISSNYDMLVLAKNTINYLSYRLAATLYLEMTYLDL
jgi:GTP pyrophosphokinase